MSMAAHGARRLARMNRNLNVIIGVELMCAAQGIEFRAPLETSAGLKCAMAVIREQIARIEQDRYMADDIARAAALVAAGTLITKVDLTGFAVGGPI